MGSIDLRKWLPIIALTISVSAHAAIRGRVLDDEAHPIAGAEIRAFAAESSAAMRARLLAGRIDRTVVASAQSAQDGSFSIDVKGQAAVDITIETDDYRRTVASVDGDDLGVIALGFQRAQNLRVTSDGKPVSGAMVVVGTYIWRSDFAGEVTTFLGAYSVVHPDYVSGHYQGVMLTDGSGITEIKLSRGVAVRGRVVDTAGPVAHAIVSINGWPLAESANDGTFAIAHAPSDWQSIAAVHGDEIGEAARGAAASVEIRMGAGAALKGSVRDATRGAAVAGARMTALAADGTWMTAVSDARGSFTFAPLSARNYRVSGLHPSYAIDSAAVTVPDARVRDFAARPLTSVRGRVLDDERHAAAGVIVYSNDRSARAAVTDASGRFTLRFAASPESPEVIHASKPGYIGGLSKAQLWQPGDAREEVELSVSAGFLFHVQVIDQNRRPVANAGVNAQRLGEGVRSIVPCYSETRSDCHHAEANGIVSFHTSEGPHELLVLGDDIAPKKLSIPALTSSSGVVVVKVDRGIEVKGRVAHADGTPVVGAIVESPTVYEPRSAISAADGTFRLSGVDAGSVRLQAFFGNRQLSSSAMTVEAPASGVTITMPRGVRLEGRVVDRATQRPINDFTIRLSSRNSANGGQRVHTDDGRYALDNVSPGSLEILVRAAGYSEGSRRDIVAEDGKTISGIDIQLDRAARVTGRVTSAGKPVAEVQVLVDPNPVKPAALATMTDRDGLYVVEGIAQGDHFIRFEKLGFVAISKPFALTESELHFDVVLDAGNELRGRVVDRSGRGVADVSVNAGAGNTATDGDGAFVLRGLSEGQYKVGVRKSGYLPSEAKLDVPQTQPLTLTLDTGATISGRVTGLPSEQLAQVVVIGDGGDGGRTYTRTLADAQGNFAIRGLPEGRVRVEASLSSLSSLSSRQATSKIVTVQNGVAPIVEMNFAEAITISGRVTKRGGPPSPNGSVFFSTSPWSPEGKSYTSVVSSDGSYSISGLTPGDYDVQVSGPGFEFRTKYTATASARFDIDMRGALLRGRVIDAATGAPLANVRIVSDMPAVETDSEGRFSIDGFADGPHPLNAGRQGYAAAYLRVVASNGAVPDAEVRMEPVPATIIRVVDAATGEPVHCNITIFGSKASIPVMPVGVGASKVWVTPGPYTVNVLAQGYPSKMIEVTISSGDVKLTIAH